MVIPLCSKISSIFPIATTACPFCFAKSRIVVPVGGKEKSFLFLVLTKFPSVPIKGRAMTRATPHSPVNNSLAVWQISYNFGTEITFSCAAI